MIADNIKKLRKERNITQKELADKLFVTAQAVSRWETGEVEVSINTIKEMCKIFNVSLEELIDGKKPEETIEKKKVVIEETYEDPTSVIIEQKPAVQEIRPVLAVCEKCNKPIYNGNEIVRVNFGRRAEIRCRDCDNKIKREKLNFDIQHGIKQRKRSFIWSGLATVVVLAISIMIANSQSVNAGIMWATIMGSLLFFPFLSCLFLQNNFIIYMVATIMSWGFVKFPGLIFSLDLDGIIWLLTVKLLFWILGILLAIVFFIVAIMIGLIVGLFVYPFALTKNIKHPELSNDI